MKLAVYGEACEYILIPFSVMKSVHLSYQKHLQLVRFSALKELCSPPVWSPAAFASGSPGGWRILAKHPRTCLHNQAQDNLPGSPCGKCCFQMTAGNHMLSLLLAKSCTSLRITLTLFPTNPSCLAAGMPGAPQPRGISTGRAKGVVGGGVGNGFDLRNLI